MGNRWLKLVGGTPFSGRQVWSWQALPSAQDCSYVVSVDYCWKLLAAHHLPLASSTCASFFDVVEKHIGTFFNENVSSFNKTSIAKLILSQSSKSKKLFFTLKIDQGTRIVGLPIS